MGERSDEIREHIDQTRGVLDRNLRELGERVQPKRVWKEHTRAVTAAAIVAGALAGWATVPLIRKYRTT